MRTTESRKPVSAPVTEAAVYDRVKLTRLESSYRDGKTDLHCRFEATDGENILPGHAFLVAIDDLEKQENLYPRLRKVMDDVSEVLGLYYKHQHLTAEIHTLALHDVVGRGQLSVIRDAVESDLRQVSR